MPYFSNRLSCFVAAGACALSSSFASGCSSLVVTGMDGASGTGASPSSNTTSSTSAASSTSTSTSTSSGQTLPPSPGADAAWSVTLVQNVADCAAQGGTDTFGVVNASMITTRLLDGSGGAAIDCAVTPVGSAGAFAVNARATLGGDSLFITIPSITAAATQASPAAGHIVYSSTQMGSPFDGIASFYFSDPAEGVTPGKIWVTFTACCLGSASTATVCDVSPSYAVFENCLSM